MNEEEVVQKIKEHNVETNIQFFEEQFTFNPIKKVFNPDTTWENILRYLKGFYGSNKERFKKYFIEGKINHALFQEFIDYSLENFDKVSTFSYNEAFQLDESFSRLVFQSIDVSEMMYNLNAKRLGTDGIEVTRKTYDDNGEYLGKLTYHNVYEVYQADGDKLGAARTECYAVKCWCTSTNKEHWIWLDGYYEDPLEAIASTFRVHDTIIPYIKELKRQGDILLVELTENVHPTKDENGNLKEANLVPLSKEQYFNMLTSET